MRPSGDDTLRIAGLSVCLSLIGGLEQKVVANSDLEHIVYQDIRDIVYTP